MNGTMKMEEKWLMAIPLSVDEDSHDGEYWQEMRERLLAIQCNRFFLAVLGKGSAAPPG